MKRTFLSVLGMVAALSTAAFPAIAAEKVKLAAMQIPLMIESPDKGLMIDFTKELAKRTGIEFEISVYPGARAVEAFRTGEADAVVPLLQAVLPDLGMEIAKGTWGDLRKNDYIFVRKGEPTPTTLEELVGRKVGITSAYRYSDRVLQFPGITFETAPSDDLNMKKLAAGRIDAFIVEANSGLQAAQAAGADVVFDGTKPVDQQEIYYAFQNTPKGQEMAKLVSQTVAEMINDGTYEKIFGFPPTR